ncbi:NADP-dependent oxidoreductase [Aeromicrobium fastidiosum]|uniref:NADP-dependent oxidoreductase n=1 Tax=Aeromicrobium fastidiosum TaxID=52699 RepID=UPI001AEB28B6|nr:NADP-dependent oxidoreductase [Aeromicrobium fastidiosum]MBP2389954.1 NADPH:quinone reductase-like Zn-dependent oxidoreductase [Aeromicrobium fastidiosum]
MTTPGDEDDLEVLDLPVQDPQDGQIRIRVHAATVNPTDTAMIRGAYYRGDDVPPGPHIPGMDLSGVVDAVGPGVDRLAVGDRVIAVVAPTSETRGAYQEQIVLPAEQVVAAPAGADDAAASTLLMNALTARLALDELAVPAGGTVAVTGAAGSFGGYVVQLAKADGLRVVADAKEGEEDLVRELGADIVVTRGDDVAANIRAAVPEGVDGLADGSVQIDQTLAAIKDGGALATIRGWEGPGERDISVHPIWVFPAIGHTDQLDRLRQQAEDGTLTLRVARTFPAEQAAEAHKLLAGGGVRGRIVLDFS